jgi:hypothetical protein
MAVDISDAEGRDRRVQRFARIVVIGGGCYGSWYTQQLTRAATRGAISVREVIVVDRHADCLVALRAREGAYAGLPVRVVVAEWSAYLASWLAEGPEALADDTLVPSPLMPHLCLEWLVARAQGRWPGRTISVEPLIAPPPTPWERGAPDGRHYVSFATWTCPINCIEPTTCPATKGPRDWSMPTAMQAFAERDPQLDHAVIFHCEHRTYGVGMIDAAAIAAADRAIAAWGALHPTRILVGTVSHCHGALGVLAVA